MSEPLEITEAQQAALNRACEILDEHFDAYALVVMADQETKDEGLQEVTRLRYYGGACQALGLFQKGTHFILTKHNDQDD